MSSSAQIAANIANAQHSTGPTSFEGKTRSAENARKFGFYSKQAVLLSDEDHFHFDCIWRNLRIRPTTPNHRRTHPGRTNHPRHLEYSKVQPHRSQTRPYRRCRPFALSIQNYRPHPRIPPSHRTQLTQITQRIPPREIGNSTRKTNFAKRTPIPPRPCSSSQATTPAKSRRPTSDPRQKSAATTFAPAIQAENTNNAACKTSPMSKAELKII